MITRREVIGLIGGAILIPSCTARSANAVRVGSAATGENATIAQIYAAALEREKIAVDRRMNLGGDADVAAAMQRDEIDVYPEYVQSKATTRPGESLLTPSPANVSPCLATSEYAAEQYWLLSLSKCAEIAPRLRLAATADFLAPDGPLKQLQKAYGGFQFKQVAMCDPLTQYYRLSRGEAEVCNAFTTDANISERGLMILYDDKHFWPRRSIAPAVRLSVLQTHPRLPFVLNRISRRLTTFALQQLNTRRALLTMDLRELAEDFVK